MSVYEDEFDGAAGLSFLRESWADLQSGREWPFGSVSSFDVLLGGSNLQRLVRMFHELIQAFLRRRQSDALDLAADVVADNPSMALQTSLISLEDALEVELGYVQVNRVAEGHKAEVLNLCQTLHALFVNTTAMDQDIAEHKQKQEDEQKLQQATDALKKPRRSSLKKSASASGIVGPSEFESFSRSGINRTNPFQSQKSAIYGLNSSRGPRDAFAEREASRRQDREDERSFNTRYSGEDDTAREGDGVRSDEDYYFLRKRSDLPLHKLTRDQTRTARELSLEREVGSSIGRSLFRAGGSARAASASPRRNPFRQPGDSATAVDSVARATDDHLLSTIDYLEKFLTRARSNARLKAQSSPWKEKLARMGGPEAAGRQSAREDEDVLPRRRSLSPSRPRSAGYMSPTVASDPWGSPSGAKFTHPDEEHELERLEEELFALRRQAAGLSPMQTDRQRERQVDHALENIRDRREIEESISMLKDYTQGRAPPQESRGESLAKSLSQRLFAAEPEHTPAHRIPTSHPHRTGKNHYPATCVYCKRELDWQSWNVECNKLLDSSFPERAARAKSPSTIDRLYGTPNKNAETGVSRLRPLASKMLEQSSDLSHSHSASAISRDFTGHFLSQLSATERRRAASRMGSLWQLVSNTERDKKAQMHRIQQEIDQENFRRTCRLRQLEEAAIERALKNTMVDRQQEREVQRLLQDQARHVAQLLELKRESLANYTRDQCDLLAERHRLERETQRMRAQNDKHSTREYQKQMREMNESLKQKKLDGMAHAEEKYSFKLSQLKRPPFSKGGIEDLRYWKTGR